MAFAGVFIMNSSGGAAPLPPGTNLSGATLEEVAGLAGTISYEILTGFTGRLPRVWS